MEEIEQQQVKFNATIEPPFRENEPEPEPKPLETKPPPKRKDAACCPIGAPPLLMSTGSSDLLDALPTILVGVGVAYAIGMATGAFLFQVAE